RKTVRSRGTTSKYGATDRPIEKGRSLEPQAMVMGRYSQTPSERLWRRKRGPRPAPNDPLQDLGRILRLRIPREALFGIAHALPSQALNAGTGANQVPQRACQLRHDVVLIRETCLAANAVMHDVTGTAEVHNYRHRSACQGLENHACAVVAKGREKKNVSGTHSDENVVV